MLKAAAPPGRGALDDVHGGDELREPKPPRPPLVYTTKSEVTLQRPDKLRVITPGDGPRSEFYYDGKTMMAFAPAENFVATADAPPRSTPPCRPPTTRPSMYFPFTDLIITDPYEEFADGLQHAFYIGQSHVVGGTTTDIVAYRQRLGVRTDLDRDRRQAAAHGPGGVPCRSAARCATSWEIHQLEDGPGDSSRRLRVHECFRRQEDPFAAPSATGAGLEAAGQGQGRQPRHNPHRSRKESGR